jgi:hypothetical protein
VQAEKGVRLCTGCLRDDRDFADENAKHCNHCRGVNAESVSKYTSKQKNLLVCLSRPACLQEVDLLSLVIWLQAQAPGAGAESMSSVSVGIGKCLRVCDCITALCTVQDEEQYKALVSARNKEYYSEHRDQILLKFRLSWRTRLRNWKANAQKRGLHFGLSDDEAKAFMWLPCAYCEKVAVPGKDLPGSIDRADNFATEYTAETAVPCCVQCNVMKRCSCPASFIAHALAVQSHPSDSPGPRLPAPKPSSYAAYKASAEVRGYDFRLTEADYLEVTAMDCAFCGRPGPVGIDRIDHYPVYSRPHVQPCCYTCNVMKGPGKDHDFRKQCAAVAKHDGRQRFKDIPECKSIIVGNVTAARLNPCEERRAAAAAGASCMIDDGFSHTL